MTYGNLLILSAVCGILFLVGRVEAKPLSAQQQTCIRELTTYKTKKGNAELSGSKINSICKKNASDGFLACVGGAERFLQGVQTAVNFCAKNPNPQARACVQGLGSFKNSLGKQEMAGSKIAATCGKNSKQSFLDCVSQSERPLSSLDTAVKFCVKNPKETTRRCVREMADYKTSKGKPLFSAKSLAPTCEHNSSTAFMDCVARTKKPEMCGKAGGYSSNRLPASAKVKKHQQSPSPQENKKPKYLPKKKKIVV